MSGPKHCLPALAALVALAAALVTAAEAIDATRFARLSITVKDTQGKALPNAKVRLVRTMPGWPILPQEVIEATTDAHGQAAFQQRRLAEDCDIGWEGTLRVELKGCTPKQTRYRFFPGADIAETITLEPARVTLIRLRGPGGEPLPSVGFSIYYAESDTLREVHRDPELITTDQRGEYRWVHGPLEEGFKLSVRPSLTGEVKYEDEPIVTVTFPQDRLPVAERPLGGKLLLPDGRPAAGWFVARKGRPTGHGGCMGGGGPGMTLTEVEGLARIGADGAFEILAGEQLFVFSPWGVPVVYPLNPRSWPDGVHKVTLQLPEVRRIHRGQVVYSDGSPVPGLPIDVRSLAMDTYWQIAAGSQPDGWNHGLYGARAADGTVVEGVRTDPQGRYALPIYFGSCVEYRIDRPGWTWPWHKGLCGDDGRIVWKREPAATPEQLKDVTIVLADEQGRPIDGMRIWRHTEFAATKEVPRLGWPQGTDARGHHLFVDRRVDAIDLEARDTNKQWTAYTSTVRLQGTEDQVVRVTVGEEHRMKPLAGRVLDPDGKPLGRAHVNLLNDDPEVAMRGTYSYLRIAAVTNDQGRFSMPAAPPTCRIEVLSWMDNFTKPLPGWLDPVAVGRQDRDLTIRVNRGGSLKILLPAGAAAGAWRLDAENDVTPPNPLDRRRGLHVEPGGNQLVTRILRPGSYHFRSYDLDTLEALGDVIGRPFEVKAGEETVIDLRDRKIVRPKSPPPREKVWTTVVVKQGEQTLSGAEMYVFAATERPENVARWLDEWRSGDRKSALARLKRAGAQAVEQLVASGPQSQVDDLLADLRKARGPNESSRSYPLGLRLLPLDLSDDAGQVRCRMEVGQPGVAVARVRGRWIGTQEFVAGSGGPVAVSMRPARTLVVHVEPDAAKDRRGLRHVLIRLENDVRRGPRGLIVALGNPGVPDEAAYGEGCEPPRLPCPVLGHGWRMPREGPSTWLLEDLPVGETCEIQLWEDDGDKKPAHEAKVKIAGGTGVQRMEW
jgi:hypothetical protein